MSPASRYAILLDGGFVIKKLQSSLKYFPSADDIEQACSRIRQHPALADHPLLRLYFYHAPPAREELYNPLDQSRLDLASTQIFRSHESLLDKLEMRPDFALRLGETVVHEWKLGSKAMDALFRNPRQIESNDLVPNISQKGVDLRIGLDIARLALRQLVDTIVVSTGDSDLVPAFKFARREGLRIFLDHMGHGIRRDLKAHTDCILDIPIGREGRTRAQ